MAIGKPIFPNSISPQNLKLQLQQIYKILNGGLNLVGVNQGNQVSLLTVQSGRVTFTGNAADQVVYSFNIPANTFRQGTILRVKATFWHNSGTANITFKFNINGSIQQTAPTSNLNTGALKVEIIWQTTKLIWLTTGCVTDTFADENFGGNNYTNDSTINNPITLTANFPATDTVQMMSFVVEMIQ